jgi:hypothetical protein
MSSSEVNTVDSVDSDGRSVVKSGVHKLTIVVVISVVIWAVEVGLVIEVDDTGSNVVSITGVDVVSTSTAVVDPKSG